jgi:hypothetical protein
VRVSIGALGILLTSCKGPCSKNLSLIQMMMMMMMMMGRRRRRSFLAVIE